MEEFVFLTGTKNSILGISVIKTLCNVRDSLRNE